MDLTLMAANPVPQTQSQTQSLVVRIKWNENGFLHNISPCTAYADLYGLIFRRFGFGRNDVVKLRYSLPNCFECFLDGDDDLKMLWTGACIYKVQSVEILVFKESAAGASNVLASSVGDSCCSGIEEADSYLGDGFRSEAVKRYLSDEWEGYINSVGQKFDSADDFRLKLKKYAVGVGFTLKYKKNDSNYVHATCGNEKNDGGTCTWFVNGAAVSRSRAFYIVRLKKEHDCGGLLRTLKHRKLDSDVVMSCIEPDVRLNGSLRPKDVVSQFKATYGFDITYKVALRAAEKAKGRLYGTEAESFNKLKWYKDAVMETNPGSYFEMEVNESTGRFKRLFIAYSGCVRGFQFCLPVLYVDGTFGKSVYKGQILAATGRNGNKGMFPLAICVCDSESEDNWYFFFSHLKKIIEPGGRAITFISDRGPGLLRAFDDIFPDGLNLYCYKHLTHNLAKRFAGSKGGAVVLNRARDIFFKLAYSSTEKEYYHNLRNFREVCGAGIVDPFLSTMQPQHWCRAFFKGCRYGIMANGLAESFNSWIRFERTMPVYSLLEQVRVKCMEMIGKRSLEAERWTGKLTPEMETHLNSEMAKARTLKVHYASPGVYEVRSDYSHSVNLDDRTCSCVKWQINCFPCPHALAAIQNTPNVDVYDYIDTYFCADTFRKCYSFPLNPISNVDEAYTESTSGYVYPPITRRPPGRRRTNRILSSGEQVKKSITCGRCHKKGNHNKLTCTEPIDY